MVPTYAPTVPFTIIVSKTIVDVSEQRAMGLFRAQNGSRVSRVRQNFIDIIQMQICAAS